MNKLSEEEIWAMSKDVASKMNEKGINIREARNTSQSQMCVYDSRIGSLLTCSKVDSEDEIRCFDYFTALTCFQMALANNQNR